MGYTTLSEVKTQLGLTTADTSQDARLTALIVGVSRAVEVYCRRHFDLRVETRWFDFQDRRAFAEPMSSVAALQSRRRYLRKLWLDDDLHACTHLINGNGTEIPSSDYFLYPLRGPPYRWIELRPDKSSVFWWEDTPQRSISVEGQWGYSTAYTQDIIPLATRLWVTQMNAQADSPGVASKGIGDFNVSFRELTVQSQTATGEQLIKPPADVALLLDGFKFRDFAAAGILW